MYLLDVGFKRQHIIKALLLLVNDNQLREGILGKTYDVREGMVMSEHNYHYSLVKFRISCLLL